MTTYTFEDATPADAQAMLAGDSLHFRSALPTEVTATYIAPTALTIAHIALSYGGKTLSFDAAALGEEGDAIDFRRDGVSHGSISLLSPAGDTLHIFSTTAKAVWAFDGNDHVTIAGPGITAVHAGAGNDLIEADNVVLADGSLAQTGYAFIDGEAGEDVVALHLATGPADVWGGTGADTIEGSSHNDHLYGNAATAIAGAPDGADSIEGGAGNDYIHGNAGDDLLHGGLGNDRVYGGSGEDVLYGEDGNDYLQGNKGDDLLAGNNGNDTVHGGAGGDQLSGGAGNDLLYGDAGNDLLSGGSGVDTLIGGTGADVFRFNNADAGFDAGASGAVDAIDDFLKGEDKIALGFQVASVITAPQTANLAEAFAYASQLMAGQVGAHEVVVMHQGPDTLLFFAHDGGDTADQIVRLMGVDYHTVDMSAFF
jgi:Ca2+-binding RTX toxin-like protein